MYDVKQAGISGIKRGNTKLMSMQQIIRTRTSET
jgi:hypothetical protein